MIGSSKSATPFPSHPHWLQKFHHTPLSIATTATCLHLGFFLNSSFKSFHCSSCNKGKAATIQTFLSTTYHCLQIHSLIGKGQFWRLGTSSLLHANIGHLMINCYSLNSVGPAIESLTGSWRFLAVYLASTIARGLLGGVATSWFVGPAWKYEILTKDGRQVFVDRAPIKYLSNRSRRSKNLT